MHEYTFKIPDEIDSRLDEIARERNTTKGAVMKTAFALLSIAHRHEKQGLSVGIIKQNGNEKFEVVAPVEVGEWK